MHVLSAFSRSDSQILMVNTQMASVKHELKQDVQSLRSDMEMKEALNESRHRHNEQLLQQLAAQVGSSNGADS